MAATLPLGVASHPGRAASPAGAGPRPAAPHPAHRAPYPGRSLLRPARQAVDVPHPGRDPRPLEAADLRRPLDRLDRRLDLAASSRGGRDARRSSPPRAPCRPRWPGASCARPRPSIPTWRATTATRWGSRSRTRAAAPTRFPRRKRERPPGSSRHCSSSRTGGSTRATCWGTRTSIPRPAFVGDRCPRPVTVSPTWTTRAARSGVAWTRPKASSWLSAARGFRYPGRASEGDAELLRSEAIPKDSVPRTERP